MIRFLSIFWLFVANISLAQDFDIFGQMMDAVNADHWEAAAVLAKSADDDIIQQVYDWNRLRAGQGSFDEFERFLAENGEWPGLPLLQAKGEGLLYAGLEPERVIEYVEHNGPQTSYGLLRYLEALIAANESVKAQDKALEYASEIEISSDDMKALTALGLNNRDEILEEAVNYLLYEREYDRARSYLEFLPANIAEIANARLGVLSRANPEPEVEDGGVRYDQMRIARNDKDASRAIDIILKSSTSREALGDPEYWADDRLDLGRNALWNNHPETAYELVSKHYLKADEKDYAELEFLAGFIALEFLEDEPMARAHFRNLKNAANTPISNGRAGYWLGRAGDPTGYGFGAKWQTSFYGQLSAEKLGGKFDEALITPEPRPIFAEEAFMNSDNIRAAKYYYIDGNVLLARRFMAHEAETLPPEDAEALGQYAFALAMPDAAVNIGKNLANRGEVIVESYYPLPNFVPQNPAAPPALLLGIMRQESEFYPKAMSHVGASGLMQLMPGTAEDMANTLEVDYRQDDLLSDPQYNVALGSAYIAEMLYYFDGKLPVAVLSYNAGPGRGNSWQEHLGEFKGTSEEAVHWLEMIPFDETRNYVQRVLEGVFLYQAKLDGEYGAYAPSDLLTKSYPKDVDYAALRAERRRIEEEKRAEEEREAAAAGLAVPEPRPADQ